MNAAKLSRSKRLQRVAAYLADCAWHTTRDIIEGAHVCAVNSVAAELRANGYNVECERQGDIWRYRMVPTQLRIAI